MALAVAADGSYAIGSTVLKLLTFKQCFVDTGYTIQLAPTWHNNARNFCSD